VPPVNLIVVPELIAKQSSWFFTTAPEIVISEEEPISKPSVLWPREPVSPAESSMVMSVKVRPLEESMENA
jgi:hypothetical protein